MMLLTMAMVLVVLFYLMNGGEPVEGGVYCAVGALTLYLLGYLLAPPFMPVNNPYAGRLFEFVPLVCFGLLLFPELAGPSHRSMVVPPTRREKRDRPAGA